MDFLKKLFGGGSGAGKDRGIYVYIKIKASGEIVQLRLTPGYDLSRDDSGHFFTRKLIMGQRSRSFEKAEALLYFDKNLNITNAEIEGGELSDAQAYEAQQAQYQD